jgi:predicted transcriptional regulator YheO
MNKEIKRYIPIAQAIAALLHPHAEVVIHDLATRKIAALFNNFSRREVGEDSLLDSASDDFPDFFEPYYKVNWDGRKIKSTTATIRNAQGKAIALFCINLDVSKYDELHKWAYEFVNSIPTHALPKELFNDDWKEKINQFVHAYFKEEQVTLKTCTKAQKKELVLLLHKEGAFRAKNAAAFVGDVLGLSRATVYKYLKGKNHEISTI